MTAPVHHCPHCGGALPGETRLDAMIRQAGLSPMQRKILLVVEQTPGLAAQQIASLVYADAVGGAPSNGTSSVITIISQGLNAKLAPFGASVSAGQGRHAGYRLFWGAPR